LERIELPPFRKVLPTSLILILIGWGGLAGIFLRTLPTLGPRWLFFFFLLCGLTGLALPIAAFLNLRFPSHPPADGGTIVRQSLWLGIYGDILAWLQMARELTLQLALFIAAGFVLIEFLIRLAERARWKPREPENE
jgi:hypothetical protein